ncbi:MAG: F0F1 ATP synthase subunit B [Armatimonadota bacterium]
MIEELFHSLGIKPGVMWVNMAGFVLLVLLLKKFAFGPVGEILAERQRGIEADLEEAERNKELALADKRAIERELDRLDERADEIISEARSEAERRRAEILERAEEQSQRIIDEGERAVEHAAERTRQQLRQETAELAVQLSERALRQALDEERQRALVDAFIADIDRLSRQSEGDG